MATQNSNNQDYQNNADGWQLAGGTTKRKLTVTGADVTLTGSGSNTYDFPAASDTLVGRDSTDTLTNKTLVSPMINTGVSGTAIDTDDTLTANSDTKIASQKAVKTYVDNQSSTSPTYIYHDWDMFDSSVWNPVWISSPQYGTQQFPTIQATNHRGRFQTSNATDNESTREVFLRAGTNWYNSEIHSVWYGNSPFLEVQILSMSGATGGTYTLTYGSQTTTALAYNANKSDVKSALEALSNIGAGNVEVGVQKQNTMPNGILTVHFIGSLAGKQCMLIKTTSSLTGTAPVVKVTSPYIPQMGHMHRAYDTGSGNYTSIMIDNNVIYQLYSQLNLQAWGFNGTLTQGSPRGNISSPTPSWRIESYNRWNFGVYLHTYKLNDISGLQKGMSIKVSNCTDTSFNGNFVVQDMNPNINTIQVICTNTATQNNVVAWTAEPNPNTAITGATNMTTDGLDWTASWADNPACFFPYHVRTAVYEDKFYAKLWRVNEKEPDKGIITSVQSAYDFSGETEVLPITEGNPGYCGLIVNHLYGGMYMEYGNVEFRKL